MPLDAGPTHIHLVIPGLIDVIMFAIISRLVFSELINYRTIVGFRF